MNSLSQSLMACPQQVQALECTCCGQLYSDKDTKDALITAKIFGAKKYAICPVCLQKVDPPWNSEYRQRWIRRVNKLIEKELLSTTPSLKA
jgi:hypothetical protein